MIYFLLIIMSLFVLPASAQWQGQPGDIVVFHGVDQVIFMDKSLPIYQFADQQIALLGISYHLPAGSYPLEISQKGQTKQEKFRVLARDFPTQRLTVPQGQTESINPQSEATKQRLARDNTLISQARSQTAQQPLWEGEFVYPIQGRLTTGFGQTRIVNDQIVRRHSGLDLAAPTGTPVKATNRGKIILAADLLVTGNTIIIDHGLGLTSSYCHLDKIHVQTGDLVVTGHIIGTVGNTGFSTGPHLHWGFRLGDAFIDPDFMVAGKLKIAD